MAIEGVQRTDTTLDYVFSAIGGLAAIWLAYLLFKESFHLGWGALWFSVLFWVLLAYFVLPRLHRILTRIYVPDYFIGRARTSDGLLGDPINLALQGSEAQVHAAMVAAGWTRADDLTLRTGWRIVTSTLLRRSYLEAPVSPLLVFGRKQDFAYQQEVNRTPGKRHHVRFWRCPDDWMLPGGHQVAWLAAGTYDRSVGLSLFTLQVTHKIAADTDVERDHIVDTVRKAEPKLEIVTIKDFSTGYHSRNGGGDSINTDGNLPILDLKKVSTAGVKTLEQPTDSRDKRPSPTVIGALFVAGRALSALFLVGVFAVSWKSVEFSITGLTASEAQPVYWFGLVALGLLAIGEGVIAVFIFRGHNWARVVAMATSTVVLAAQALSVELGGPPITIKTNLVGLSLDILLILALSSERSLIYARRPHKAEKYVAARATPRAAAVRSTG